jgi:hypothetical protein
VFKAHFGMSPREVIRRFRRADLPGAEADESEEG